MFTLKAPYFNHILELIQLHGTPRSCSNFSKEGMIGIIKTIYRNTNSCNKEVSVFDRYRIILFWEVFYSITGHSSKNILKQWVIPSVTDEDHLATDYFASYTRVTILNIDGSVITSNGKDFDLHFLKAKGSYNIFNYHGVTENDCILLRPLPQIDDFNCPHAGFFKDVLMLDGNIYITYELPEQDNETNMMYKTNLDDSDIQDEIILMQHEVSATRIPVLHIVPLDTSFVSRLYLYRSAINKYLVIH
jgi:hypothetical protein